MNEWIPVAEKLPESGKIVLIQGNMCTSAHYDAESKNWIQNPNANIQGECTHWREIEDDSKGKEDAVAQSQPEVV